MRGIMVFDQMNDIVFTKLDQELEKHLLSVAEKQGLTCHQTQPQLVDGASSSLNESSKWFHNELQLTPNMLVQLFSPLLMSQYIMQNQFHNAYASIVCEDGLRLTFATENSHQFLAVSFDVEEAENLAAKRLAVFIKLVNMLYGAAYNALRREFYSGSDARPKLLSSLISKWEKLYAEDQSFLIEATERVLVNRALSSICIKLLERVLESMKKVISSPYTACHSFILIGTKLLNFYSSRNASTLSSSDILLLTVLANTVHSQDKKLKHVGITASLQLGYDSAPSDKTNDALSEPRSEFSRVSRLKRSAAFIKNLYPGQKKDSSLVGVNRHMDISYHLLFLQTPDGLVVPHVVYNIRIVSGMVLIIICEGGKRLLTTHLINSINVLLAARSEQNGFRTKKAADTLEFGMVKIFNIANQSKLSYETQRVLKLTSLKWDQIVKLKFLDFLRKSDQQELNAKTEAVLSSLYDSLKELYYHLVYSPEVACEQFVPTAIQETLLSLQKESKAKLTDYIDYLIVKSTRNITMASYSQDYPGLLHFIYVDRTTNFMLAPYITKETFAEIEETAETESDLISLSTAKIWKMVQFTHKQILLGHTSVMWRDKKHYCTYFLWFEDGLGNALTPQKSSLNLHHLPPPGALSGDFYKRYTKECFPNIPSNNIHCYELMCIHVGATSATFIVNFSRRLAAQLWEISGNTASPMDLL